ncbi:MAG: 50S ribosomal protein L13 [Candidatus Kapaibacterium sp.]
MTKSIRKEDTQHDWWLVDASGMTLGRLATQVARLIRGKHKPWFTPHNDCGDFVVVVNADQIKVTGKRAEMKTYSRYSGYPGGITITPIKEMLDKKPEFVVHHAVKGMLPKNRLGRQIIKKLKVYAGGEHPHAAQQPEKYEMPYKAN